MKAVILLIIIHTQQSYLFRLPDATVKRQTLKCRFRARRGQFETRHARGGRSRFAIDSKRTLVIGVAEGKGFRSPIAAVGRKQLLVAVTYVVAVLVGEVVDGVLKQVARVDCFAKGARDARHRGSDLICNTNMATMTWIRHRRERSKGPGCLTKPPTTH